jgi:hypothetical protein
MGRKKKVPPGTWIERELFQSRAFLSLRGFAPQLLILFLGKRILRYTEVGKRKRWQCLNCQEMTMTYVKLQKKYGITNPRFSRALDDLLGKGFIEICHQGGAYQRDKSVYALSDKWQIWSDGAVFQRRKPDVYRGYQGRNKDRSTPKLKRRGDVLRGYQEKSGKQATRKLKRLPRLHP